MLTQAQARLLHKLPRWTHRVTLVELKAFGLRLNQGKIVGLVEHRLGLTICVSAAGLVKGKGLKARFKCQRAYFVDVYLEGTIQRIN